MEYVSLVNRTSRDLFGKWDGRQYRVPAAQTVAHPRIIAEAIRNQNPIMGSDDEMTGQLQYLLGIPEEGDPVEPIEQSTEIELFNRKYYKNAQPVMIVQGNGLFQVKQTLSPVPGTNSNFVAPDK